MEVLVLSQAHGRGGGSRFRFDACTSCHLNITEYSILWGNNVLLLIRFMIESTLPIISTTPSSRLAMPCGYTCNPNAFPHAK
jgi:hypothetical protein